MRTTIKQSAFIAILAMAGTMPAAAQYGAGPAVYCKPEVIEQMKAAWKADANGTLRAGTWEYGFRIDYSDYQITPRELIRGDEPRHVAVPTTPETIATVHVHPEWGVADPSDADAGSPLPVYVISRGGLYVTNPKTKKFVRLRTFAEMFSTDGCGVAKNNGHTKQGS